MLQVGKSDLPEGRMEYMHTHSSARSLRRCFGVSAMDNAGAIFRVVKAKDTIDGAGEKVKSRYVALVGPR
jgi:hypothetical protein